MQRNVEMSPSQGGFFPLFTDSVSGHSDGSSDMCYLEAGDTKLGKSVSKTLEFGTACRINIVACCVTAQRCGAIGKQIFHRASLV